MHPPSVPSGKYFMYPLLYTIIRDTWSACAFSFEVTADRKKAESSPRRTALSWSLSDPEWGWITKQKFNINFCKLCGTFLDFEPSIFTATLFVQLYWELLLRKLLRYCWFSHDVTTVILLSRCIRALLKTNFHTNFRFKRVLVFVVEYAWISKLLRDAAFTWQPGELSCRLKKNGLFSDILLSKQFMY